MILYKSHSLHLLGLTGSVIPRAACYALISTALAVVLEVLDEGNFMSVQESVNDNAAFGMYTSTLAFLLVFRTSKSYSRFWHCASSACTFRAQLKESASSLVTFSQMSSSPEAEVQQFRRSLVSFCSVLHAAAMSSVSELDMSYYAVIDYNSIDEGFRKKLETHTPRNRVDLAYMWINTLIMKNVKQGLLNVPPPILSRVFQELEKSMIEYNQVLEIMTIPFPFPYAQTAMLLLLLVGFFTPFAMVSWTAHPMSAGVLTFIAVVCLVSLELIANELEKPFGHAANDLPCTEFQEQINESLLFLLSDDAVEAPEPVFKAPPQIELADSGTEFDQPTVEGVTLGASGAMHSNGYEDSTSSDPKKAVHQSVHMRETERI